MRVTLDPWHIKYQNGRRSALKNKDRSASGGAMTEMVSGSNGPCGRTCQRYLSLGHNLRSVVGRDGDDRQFTNMAGHSLSPTSRRNSDGIRASIQWGLHALRAVSKPGWCRSKAGSSINTGPAPRGSRRRQSSCAIGLGDQTPRPPRSTAIILGMIIAGIGAGGVLRHLRRQTR